MLFYDGAKFSMGERVIKDKEARHHGEPLSVNANYIG